MVTTPDDSVGVGHNNPPSMTEFVSETAASINAWLQEHPIIDSEDMAREAKPLIDRGRLCLKDLEAERDRQVRPLNEKIAEINGNYKRPKTLLQAILDELQRRLSDFMVAEEQRRLVRAAEAARIAAEAEAAAREAERIEKERIDNAKQGELGVDVLAATEDANKKFEAYQKAQREAQRAERDSTVKIGGGFSRAASLRDRETLVVTDAAKAVKALGLTSKIEQAIISDARAYRRLHSKLPPGIEAKVDRS